MRSALDEAVATLTALEQERANVATLVEALTQIVHEAGMAESKRAMQQSLADIETMALRVLSDLSAASAQRDAKMRADAVAEERERLLKGSEEASDELASMCHYLRGFIEEEDQDGIDQVEFYLEKVDGRAPWRLVPLALLAPEQP